MKSHDEIRGWLPAMAGGELSAVDRALVEQHLADCPICRRELAQLQAVVQAMRNIPELEPPPWLASRIMAQVREEAASHKGWFARLFLPLQIKLPLELFVVLTVCVIAWQVVQNLDPSAPMQPSVTSPPSPAGQVATGTPETDVSSPARQAESTKAKRLSIAPPAAPPVQPLSPIPEPAFERVDRARPAAESSVAAPGLRDQAVDLPTAPDQRTMASKRAAGQTDSRKKAGVVPSFVRLRMVTDEPAMVLERLRPVVERLEGSLLDRGAGHAVAKLEAGHLSTFMEQVARLGRITERPTGPLPREGWVEVQLLW